MIDKHFYPKDFDFDIMCTGIDHRSSLLKSGRPVRRDQFGENGNGTALLGPTKPSRSGEGETIGETIHDNLASKQPKQELQQKMDLDHRLPSSSPSANITTTARIDAEIDDLAGAMSSLKFIPLSVRFGRGGGRGKGRGGLSKA